MGFTGISDSSCPIPLCLICVKRLTIATMAPAKVKRHLSTNHNHITSKNADYFKRLLDSQNKQNRAFVSKVPVSEKAQEANYLVAELIAQKRKSHTVGENLIMPACKIIMGKMRGKNAVGEFKNIPLSKQFVNRHIDDMSHDAEVLRDKQKNNNFYIQVNESTDFTNLPGGTI
jgi:hypothetical protein